MFYLKQYDTVLLSFEIIEDPLEGQKCRIHMIDKAHSTMLPIGMKKTDEGLMSWLRGRIIPKNREYVDTLLAKSGLSSSPARPSHCTAHYEMSRLNHSPCRKSPRRFSMKPKRKSPTPPRG